MSYSAKNHKTPGGEIDVIGGSLQVASGGKIQVLTGGAITPNSGTQAAHIADAVVAHALNETFSDTEVEGALDALGVKINAILAALEGAGILASS